MRALLLILFCGSALATTEPPVEETGQGSAQPALGIGETFGRWDDTVRLVYDPDNAPSIFSNQSHMQDLLQQAIDQWKRVSGLDIEIVGIDRNSLDDESFNIEQQDGLVRVFWSSTIGTSLGRAGPNYNYFDSELGYYPYFDGDIKLNASNNVWDDDLEMVGTLVHELGHLLGLGHSDNPASVMYANPYNGLNYPRADDIRAMQALYGLPSTAISSTQAQADWLYTPPVASQVWYLQNSEYRTKDSWFSINNQEVSQVANSNVASDYVWLEIGTIDNIASNTPFSTSLKLIVVDPSGYITDSYDWSLNCGAQSYCTGAARTIAWVAKLRSVPGIWKVYLLDENSGPNGGSTILEMALPVYATNNINLAPSASIALASVSSSTQATFTVSVDDPENDQVTVKWHVPGANSNRGSNIVGSSQQVQKTLTFSSAGSQTFFVEIIDNSVRYDGSAATSSSAGLGFRTLLQVEVDLPVTNAQTSMRVVSSSRPEQTVASTATLTAISSETASKVTASNGTSTSAVFRYGASTDNGVSTKEDFTRGDEVIIAGSIAPQLKDLNKSADIFVVIRSIYANEEIWTYRDIDGNYRPWDEKLSSLQPAFQVDALSQLEAFEIYSGSLAKASHRVFTAYRVPDIKYLYYTKTALRLDVSD